jgi:hypothetical protein
LDISLTITMERVLRHADLASGTVRRMLPEGDQIHEGTIKAMIKRDLVWRDGPTIHLTNSGREEAQRLQAEQ